jgi:hypothetical protein
MGSGFPVRLGPTHAQLSNSESMQPRVTTREQSVRLLGAPLKDMPYPEDQPE